MSLLNDALRKKDKELKQPGKVNLFQDMWTGRRYGSVKKYVFFSLILIACILFIWVRWQLFLEPGTSLTKPQIAEKRKIGDDKRVSPDTVKAIPISSNVAGPGPDAAAAQIEEQNSHNDDKVIPGQKVGINNGGSQPITPLTTMASEKNEKGEGKRSATPFYLKAVSYHRRNEFAKAIQMYQEVLRKDPENYDALFNLASAYLNVSSFTDAYIILRKLEETDPKNPKILLNLAIAEIGLGRPYNAISNLDDADALKNSPQFEILFHRGVALSKVDMLNEAETCYKKAEELEPNHPRLLFNLAVIYDKLQRWEESLRYYGAFLRNEEGASAHERKEIKARIKAIRVYMGSTK